MLNRWQGRARRRADVENNGRLTKQLEAQLPCVGVGLFIIEDAGKGVLIGGR